MPTEETSKPRLTRFLAGGDVLSDRVRCNQSGQRWRQCDGLFRDVRQVLFVRRVPCRPFPLSMLRLLGARFHGLGLRVLGQDQVVE